MNKKGIFQRVFEASKQCGNRVALYDEDSSFTYSQLIEASLKVKQYVEVSTNDYGSRIAVIMPRSFNVAVSMLGIFAADRVYVPIDLNYPKSMRQHMCQESEVKLIITTQLSEPAIVDSNKGIKIVCIEDILEQNCELENKMVFPPIDREAIILFTSGSTGMPKGAVHSERHLLFRINWLSKDYPINQEEVCGQRSSISFIPSLWEYTGPLFFGASIIIIPNDVMKSPEDFSSFIYQHNISRLFLVPFLLKMLLTSSSDLYFKLASLKWVSVAGASFPVSYYKKLNEVIPSASILNEYGSTEGNGITYFDIHKSSDLGRKTIPIGRPIPGVHVYVLNNNMKNTLPGEVGKLYVSNKTTFDRYLRGTLEKTFIKVSIGGKDEFLFDTNDLVTRDLEGELTYIGRDDNVLKIKGARLSPETIESVISQTDGVDGCVVVPWYSNGDDLRGLKANILIEGDSDVILENAKNLVKNTLPDFMSPSLWSVVDSLPKTPTGKIDRKPFKISQKPLPVYDSENTGCLRRFVIGVIEAMLNTVLTSKDLEKSLLELGFDSLTTTELSIYISDETGFLVTVKNIFESNTINVLIDNLISISLDQVNKVKKDEQLGSILSELNKGLGHPTKFGGREKVVLLTGSTGFLGVHLLKELLDKGYFVNCVLRKTAEIAAEEKLKFSLDHFNISLFNNWESRVNAFYGDITDASPDSFKVIESGLKGNVSSVIHSSAEVHHLFSTEKLLGPNAISTLNLINFAFGQGIDEFYYVSTTASTGIVGDDTVGSSSGYAESKWIGEKLVEEAFKRGLKGHIFRCGNISPALGYKSKSRENVVINTVLRLFKSNKYNIEDENYYFDIVPADIVSNSIIEMMENKNRDFSITEITHPKPPSLKGIMNLLGNKNDEIISLNCFLKKAKDLAATSSDKEFKLVRSFFEGEMPIKAYFEPHRPEYNSLFSFIELNVPDTFEVQYLLRLLGE